MAPAPIPLRRPAAMATQLAACSRNDDGSRPRAATHERPSGRSRPQRIDPSTITSPTTRSCTQISPGVRGRIGPVPAQPTRNHSPPWTGGPASDKSSWRAKRAGLSSGLSGRVAEAPGLRQRFEPLERVVLDLADALTRHAERPADLLERARLGAGEPEAELDHLPLPFWERVERLLDVLAA